MDTYSRVKQKKPLCNYSRIVLEGHKDKVTKYVLRDMKLDNRNKKGDNRYVTKIDHCCVCSLALYKRHISRVYITANIARESVAKCRELSKGNVEHGKARVSFSLSQILYAIFFQVHSFSSVYVYADILRLLKAVNFRQIVYNSRFLPKQQFGVQYTEHVSSATMGIAREQPSGHSWNRNLQQQEHEAALCEKWSSRTKI
jgi:hypothetical protein